MNLPNEWTEDGRVETHFILMKGLEVCFRCQDRAPVVLVVAGAVHHQALCAECLDDQERDCYHRSLELARQWELEHGAQDDEGS